MIRYIGAPCITPATQFGDIGWVGDIMLVFRPCTVHSCTMGRNITVERSLPWRYSDTYRSTTLHVAGDRVLEVVDDASMFLSASGQGVSQALALGQLTLRARSLDCLSD